MKQNVKKSQTMIRLESMLKAFEAGKLKTVNGHKDGQIPKRDFKNMPNNTVYASL